MQIPVFKTEKTAYSEQQLAEARSAFGQLKLPVEVNLKDPEAVKSALAEVSRIIDDRAAAYPDNPLVRKLGESTKERIRNDLLERAARARREATPDSE